MALTSDHRPLQRFLESCADEIDRRVPRQRANRKVIAEGAAAFRVALQVATFGPAADDSPSASMPVARWLHQLDDGPLAERAAAAAPELPWTPSPRLDDAGVTAGLSPLNAVCSLPGVLAGLLLLAPHGVYPEHSHAPQEIYLPISGHGRWRFGGSTDLCALGPDALVYNRPDDVHRVDAGAEPLLALYVLWPVADPVAPA